VLKLEQKSKAFYALLGLSEQDTFDHQLGSVLELRLCQEPRFHPKVGSLEAGC